MASDVTLTVDSTPMQAALGEYMRYTRRTLQEVIDKKVGDWAMTAAKLVTKATRDSINAFKDDPRFFGYIARLVGSGTSMRGRRKAKGEERFGSYIDPVSGQRYTGTPASPIGRVSYRKTIQGQRKSDFVRNKRGQVLYAIPKKLRDGIKKSQFAAVARKVIRRRLGRVNALSAMLLYVAGKFGKQLSKVGHTGQYQGDTIKFTGKKRQRQYILTGLVEKHADPTNLGSSFSMPVGGISKGKLDGWNEEAKADTGQTKTPTESANARSRLIFAAVLAAQPVVIADMWKHIQRRQEQEAARISGGRAAA